jgi:hypothetical protein
MPRSAWMRESGRSSLKPGAAQLARIKKPIRAQTVLAHCSGLSCGARLAPTGERQQQRQHTAQFALLIASYAGWIVLDSTTQIAIASLLRVDKLHITINETGRAMSDQKQLRSRIAAFLAVAAVMLGGCASEFTKVSPQPPEKYERLGPATGSACGSLMVLATAYNFIPVMLNSRVERAYADAVASVPGATALVDVTMNEDWFWWVLGTARCVTIHGEAVR